MKTSHAEMQALARHYRAASPLPNQLLTIPAGTMTAWYEAGWTRSKPFRIKVETQARAVTWEIWQEPNAVARKFIVFQIDGKRLLILARKLI